MTAKFTFSNLLGIFILCLTLASTTILFAQERGTIVSTEILESFTQAELMLEGVFTAQNGINLYKVIYNTIDPNGNPTTASGAMVIPIVDYTLCEIPVASYQHGTTTDRDGVPSRQSQEILVGYFLGGDGFVVNLPDYLGMGDGPGFHPYVHARSEASAAIDMLRAMRLFCAEAGISLSEQLFLGGYSQGGHATMALHREIEQFHSDEFTVTASACGSTPTDISGIMTNIMVTDAPYGSPGYLPYTNLSYQSVYGDLYEDLSEVFVAPYDSLIPILFDGSNGLGVIDPMLPEVPMQMLTDTAIQAITDSTSTIAAALRDNDVYDWVPQNLLRLYYCEGDELIPFANSVFAENHMNGLGATTVDKQRIDSDAVPLTHGAGAQPTLFTMRGWFLELLDDCVLSGIADSRATAQTVHIVPNPMHTDQASTLFFDNPTNETLTLRIIDLAGQVVHQQNNIRNNQVVLGQDGFSPGLYLVELMGESTVFKGKIVVQ